jgi:hypothetical protein
VRALAERSVHRVRNDGDLLDLLRQARAVRTEDPVFSTRSVHLLLFGVECGRSVREDLAEPVHCGRHLSLVRIPPG